MNVLFKAASAAAIAVASIAATAASAAVTYHFTGDCQESASCSGEATAALTLTDYVYGDSFDAASFVSFSYEASNVSFTIDQSGLNTLSGQFAAFDFEVFHFPLNVVYVSGDDTNGDHRSFYSYTTDGLGWFTDDTTHGSGFDHEWDAAPPSSDVPEPASWAMMIGGFGLVGAAMRRRRVAVRFA
jgi:hypothetical protein